MSECVYQSIPGKCDQFERGCKNKKYVTFLTGDIEESCWILQVFSIFGFSLTCNIQKSVFENE